MGITYIDGVSFGTSSYDNFFAILKDGKTAVIDYAKNIGNYVDADGNSTIWQAAAGSQWLVRDGKDVTAGAASNTGFVNPYQEPGWHYLSIDLSAYKGLYLHQGYIVQFYISDRDGAGITSIGRYAFSHLYACTSITFAEGSKLEKIEVTGFYYDFQVTSVVLPETVRSIGVLAFGNMYGLTDLYVPRGVSMIGDNAFRGSGQVTLSVAAGSYAELYAVNQNIAHISRDK